MLAVMGLIRPPGRTTADLLRFDGIDLLRLSPRARRGLVGKDVAMIFQEPMTSLNPCFTIGWQIAEALRVHLDLSRSAARARTIDLLRQVGIPAPEQRIAAFPHLLSGGMNQRAMIAMAIACNPRLLIADEPTTALDVTIQKQILELLATLQHERGMALVLISHDMGVIAQSAQRVQVMYAGQAMESLPGAIVVECTVASIYRGAAGCIAGTCGLASPAGDNSRRGAWCCGSTGRLPVRASLPVRVRSLRRASRARCAW